MWRDHVGLFVTDGSQKQAMMESICPADPTELEHFFDDSAPTVPTTAALEFSGFQEA
jgi:hypothetical protein